MKRACGRCARRLARSGYRRRCPDCRAALRSFQKAAAVLLELQAETAIVLAPGGPRVRSEDLAPPFGAFQPWLFCAPGGTLHVIERDPEGRIHRSIPWAT